jgi:hypothetical protein
MARGMLERIRMPGTRPDVRNLNLGEIGHVIPTAYARALLLHSCGHHNSYVHEFSVHSTCKPWLLEMDYGIVPFDRMRKEF